MPLPLLPIVAAPLVKAAASVSLAQVLWGTAAYFTAETIFNNIKQGNIAEAENAAREYSRRNKQAYRQDYEYYKNEMSPETRALWQKYL